MVDTITAWGVKDGYFVDDTEAEAFRAELKHLVVHQKAAFNSPVWFNIGVKGEPAQASACFILAVDDTMQSILNWYVEEGTIFKGGSGSGINLSNIRSSLEPLKGGGTASGPVSFMRGADASAGTIKCLHADTDLVTDHGVVPIRDASPRAGRCSPATADDGRRGGARQRRSARWSRCGRPSATRSSARPSTGSGCAAPSGEGWREAGRLRPDDYVHRRPRRTPTTARSSAGSRPRQPHRRSASALPAMLDEAFAVWLGWAYGDGRLTPWPGAELVAVHLDGEDKDARRAVPAPSPRACSAADVHLYVDRPGRRRVRRPRFVLAPDRPLPRGERPVAQRTCADLRVPASSRSSPAVGAGRLPGRPVRVRRARRHGYRRCGRRVATWRSAHRLLHPSAPVQIGPSRSEGQGASPTDARETARARSPSGPDGVPGRIVGEEGVRRFAKLVGFVSEGKARLLEAALRPQGRQPFETHWFLPHVDAGAGADAGSTEPALRRRSPPYCRDAQPRTA